MIAQAHGTNDFKSDHVFQGDSAWIGASPTSDKLTAFGFFDQKGTEDLKENNILNTDMIRLSDALRFTGDDRMQRNAPAGTNIWLPHGKYSSAEPFGGTFAELMLTYLAKKDSKFKDVGKARAVLPPPLVREGERVQPEWLYKFLLNPGPIRPEDYLILRMPKFNMSPEESRALVNYFAAASRATNPGAGITYPYVSIEQRDEEYWKQMNSQYVRRLQPKDIEERARSMKPVWEAKAKKDLATLEAALPDLKLAEADALAKKAPELPDRTRAVKEVEKRIAALKDDVQKSTFTEQRQRWQSSEIYARDAFKLLTNKALCLTCHNIGNLPSSGAQGPNLALAGERLRPGWAEKWIAHPNRMFTYPPVMPQNFPNETDRGKYLYQDNFNGSPFDQTRAVRDILMDQPRLNDLLANPAPQPSPAGGGK